MVCQATVARTVLVISSQNLNNAGCFIYCTPDVLFNARRMFNVLHLISLVTALTLWLLRRNSIKVSGFGMHLLIRVLFTKQPRRFTKRPAW